MMANLSRYEVPEDWPARPAALGLALTLCSSLMWDRFFGCDDLMLGRGLTEADPLVLR
jgi:hypothetical protein